VIQRIALAEARTSWVQLTLHALSLAGALFLVGLWVAAIADVASVDAPGVRCSDMVRRLEIASDTLPRAPARELQRIPEVPNRFALHTVTRVAAADAVLLGAPVVLMGADILAAACVHVDEGGEPALKGIVAHVAANRAHPWAAHPLGARIDQTAAAVVLGGRFDAFRGLGTLGDTVAVAAPEARPVLGIGTTRGRDEVWIGKADTADWSTVTADIQSFVESRPDIYGSGPEVQWTFTSGMNEAKRRSATIGVALMGIVVLSVLFLVLANLGIFYVARQARLAALCGTLASLGAPPSALWVVAAVEPVIVAAFALGLSMVATYLFIGQGTGASDPPWTALCLAVSVFAVASALLVAQLRVRGGRQSMRQGVKGGRRITRLVLPALLALQGVAAIPVAAMGTQAISTWLKLRPSAVAVDMERLWVLRFALPADEAHGVASAIAFLEAEHDPVLGFATQPLPLPARHADSVDVRIDGEVLAVTTSRITPSALRVLGLAPARDLVLAGGQQWGVSANTLIPGAALGTMLGQLTMVEVVESDTTAALALTPPLADRRRAGGFSKGSLTQVTGYMPLLSDGDVGRDLFAFVRADAAPVALAHGIAAMLPGALESVSTATQFTLEYTAPERRAALNMVLTALLTAAAVAAGVFAVVAAMLAAARPEFAVHYAIGRSVGRVRLRFARIMVVPATVAVGVGGGLAFIATYAVASTHAAPVGSASIASVAGCLAYIGLAALSFTVLSRSLSPATLVGWLKRE
jgi:hypothetical protein